jgi:hypothetical protein
MIASSTKCHCWNLVKDGNGVLDQWTGEMAFFSRFQYSKQSLISETGPEQAEIFWQRYGVPELMVIRGGQLGKMRSNWTWNFRVEQVKQAQRRTKNRTQSLLPVSLQMFGVPSPVRAVLFLLQFYFFKRHVIAGLGLVMIPYRSPAPTR